MRRFGADFIDTDSRVAIKRDALLEHRVADIRRAVEARVGSRPFSGRWRFGNDVGGQLCGTEGMEPSPENEVGQSR